MTRQCSSCGGFCKKSGCERDSVKSIGSAEQTEIAELKDVLLRSGFVHCDIPACNCGSWHHRYGLPERMEEIKDVLRKADVLNNSTGNLPVKAINKLVTTLASHEATILKLREALESHIWDGRSDTATISTWRIKDALALPGDRTALREICLRVAMTIWRCPGWSLLGEPDVEAIVDEVAK